MSSGGSFPSSESRTPHPSKTKRATTAGAALLYLVPTSVTMPTTFPLKRTGPPELPSSATPANESALPRQPERVPVITVQREPSIRGKADQRDGFAAADGGRLIEAQS